MTPAAAIEAAFADLAGNAPPAQILARLARIEPGREAPLLQARLLHARGLALNRVGLPGEALGALHAACDLLGPGDAAEAAAIRRSIAQVHAWRGEGREAALALLSALAGSRTEPEAFALGLIEAGRLNLEIGRPAEARALFGQGLAAGGEALGRAARQRAAVALAQACLAADDDAAARDTLERIDLAAAAPRIRHLVRIERARLALRGGDLDGAEALLRAVRADLPAEPRAFEHAEHGEVAAALHLRRGEPEAALALTRRLVARYAEDDLAAREVGARLLEAEGLDATGDAQGAERTLLAALRRARARGLNGQADRLRAGLSERGASTLAWSPGEGATVPAPEAGARFVRRRPLGAGGFGAVTRAYDLETGTEVALKRLRLAALYDAAARETLADGARREVAAASRIRHPGVGKVFGLLDEADGDALLVRELVEGPTLREALGEAIGAAPGLPERLALVAQLAHALGAIHAAGVVHHDLKPENVVLRGGATPVVIDFGISTIGPGRGGCTPAYAAPEQIAGRTAGRSADLFALGTLAFELVTGALPERLPAGLLAILARRRARARLRALWRRAGAPEALAGLMLRLLHPRPGARPGAGAVAAAFQRR